jgi:Putative pectate lyase-like adhesive domain
MVLRLVALVGLVAAPLVGAVATSGPAGATDSDGGVFRTAWATQATGTIDLSADVVLGCTDGGGDGVALRNVGAPIVVDGHGHTITQTCRVGTNNGVLDQTGEGDVTLQNLTLTGGQTNGDGGGLDMQEPDTPSLTIINSTFAGNSACGVGGGVAHDTSGTVTITGSTFSGNTTGRDGGGIDDDLGMLTVTNSTITGNTSPQGEGGIDSDATQGVHLVYTTLVGNIVDPTVACEGAGSTAQASGKPSPPPHVHAQTATVDSNLFTSSNETFQAFGTVIANPMVANMTETPVNCDISGAHASQGYNYATDTTCDLTASTDNQATTNNPLLGALANNGGPTQTMLPQDGPSPLIDGVAAAPCQAEGITIDQRGLPRPDSASPACDIGAVEVQLATVAPTLTAAFTG